MSPLVRSALAGVVLTLAPCILLAQGRGGEPPKNLQVLPKDMTRQQVLGVMNGFTAALGVRCEHCHMEDANAAAVTPPAGGPPGGGRGGPPLDFANDGKENKKVAREMLKMVVDINGKYLPLTGRTIGERDKVNCETCHHGLSRPQTLRTALAIAAEANGADSATALYRALRTRYYGSASYDFSETALTVAANDLARMNQTPAALALLKINLEYYAQSAPTMVALAQIQLQKGDTAQAIDALKKAMGMQPANPQIRGMLQRLGVNP